MKKILIVDDEPNIVMTLDYALQKKGYKVFIARDGEEAVEIAKKEVPNLILMDIMMPNMDGYEAYGKIKQINEQIKLIFLSAKNKTQDIEKGMKMGADDYITKPFSIKKVLETIEEKLKNINKNKI